jgi:acyl-CoA synthetase (AMP-forming)/AMP-acid ligase II
MQTVFDETNPEQLTLVDILRWRAQHQPQREAYTFLLDGETKKVQITYAELDLQARRIAALLQDHTAPGERALLLYPSGLEYVAAVFGCFYAGVVAVPAYPPRLDQSLTRVQTILQDTQAMTVLTTSAIFSSLHHTFASDPWDNVQDLRWIETDTIDTVGAQDRDKPLPLRPEMLALLQYTSGSTGSPKGVMFTHDHLMQSAALTQAAATLTPQDRAVFWTPPYHNLGLVGSILQALYTGFPTTLMAPETFLQQPLRWLQVLSSWQATVSGAPNFAYDLCVKKATQDDIKTLNLSHWAIAFVSGEPVRAETLERFAATFAPCGFRPEALYPCYGMTEATLLVSASRRLIKSRVRTFEREALEAGRVVETTGQRVADRPLVNCGSVQPRQEIVIVDPQTLTPCPPDTIGEIWFRGPNIAGGYWGKTEETIEMFQAFLANGGDGPFFRTGDLGFCVENELYLTGRIKDLIIIRGRNLYPQDIELVVEKSHPLLRPGGCAAFTVEGPTSEQLVVVQEVVSHADDAVMQEAMQSIFRTVPSEFDVEVTAIALVDTGTIPRTVMGKMQRHTCRRLFLADKLNTVACWVGEASSPLQFGVSTGTMPTCSGELASPTSPSSPIF